MSKVAKTALALALFAVWVPTFLVVAYFILGGFVFGRLGLPTDYEMPFMGLMLLLCLFSYAFFVEFALRKVSR